MALGLLLQGSAHWSNNCRATGIPTCSKRFWFTAILSRRSASYALSSGPVGSMGCVELALTSVVLRWSTPNRQVITFQIRKYSSARHDSSVSYSLLVKAPVLFQCKQSHDHIQGVNHAQLQVLHVQYTPAYALEHTYTHIRCANAHAITISAVTHRTYIHPNSFWVLPVQFQLQ